MDRRYLFVLPIFILVTSIIGSYRFGVLPGAKEPNLDMITKQDPDYKSVEEKLSGIPQHLSVAASNNVGSHLAHRQRLFTFPIGIEKADVIVFYPTVGEQARSIKAQDEQELKMRSDLNYEIDTEKGSFVIFRKKNK